MALRVKMLCLIALLSVSPAHAATLYKWIDPDGNVSYHDRPPPSGAGYRVEEKNVKTAPAADASADAATKAPVVLYLAPGCGPCDSARAYLEARGVPYTEKNVEGDPEIQKELMERAGQLSVPTITVGPKVMRGYLESLLEGELDAAGYPRTGAGDNEDAEEGA